MSSGQAKKAEAEAEEQYNKQLDMLSELSESISTIRPNTPEAEAIFWIFRNKDKIIKNRMLIDSLRNYA